MVVLIGGPEVAPIPARDPYHTTLVAHVDPLGLVFEPRPTAAYGQVPIEALTTPIAAQEGVAPTLDANLDANAVL